MSPAGLSDRVAGLLEKSPSACNVIVLDGAARKPEGDVVMADVAREDASVLLSDLRELGIEEHGSIALESIETSISKGGERAVKAAKGSPSDAVIWEQVQFRRGRWWWGRSSARSPASASRSSSARVAWRCDRWWRSRWDSRWLLATYLVALLFRAGSLPPENFSFDVGFAHAIASPDFFAFFVAFCAGVAGMLSLTTAKSGALIGVLISVTTIPSAAAIGVAAAYRDSDALAGSAAQLGVNLAMILTAGTATLLVQRAVYARRRRMHLTDSSRQAAGLPVGRERHDQPEHEPV